jgi:hypothetical protein
MFEPAREAPQWGQTVASKSTSCSHSEQNRPNSAPHVAQVVAFSGKGVLHSEQRAWLQCGQTSLFIAIARPQVGQLLVLVISFIGIVG